MYSVFADWRWLTIKKRLIYFFVFRHYHLKKYVNGYLKEKGHVPTKAIYKAHKANQVTKIKRLLDTTTVSLDQVDSVLKTLQG